MTLRPRQPNLNRKRLTRVAGTPGPERIASQRLILGPSTSVTLHRRGYLS